MLSSGQGNLVTQMYLQLQTKRIVILIDIYIQESSYGIYSNNFATEKTESGSLFVLVLVGLVFLTFIHFRLYNG